MGELIAGKKLGKKAMLWGILANNLPDADVFIQIFLPTAKGLLVHRGFTHSILFMLIFSGLLSWLCARMKKSPDMSFRDWLFMWMGGLACHILLDAFTAYGTGWFEPFSSYRVSFNAMFIIDPFFTVPVLIACIALIVLKKHSQKRKAWAKVPLIVATAYLLLILAFKWVAAGVIKENIQQQQIAMKNYMFTPAPFSSLLWYVIIREQDQYRVGYYSLLDKDKHIELKRVPRNEGWLKSRREIPDIKNLIQFSKDFYCVSGNSESLTWNDMRFGTEGAWYRDTVSFVFNFQLNDDPKNPLQKQRFKNFNKEAMSRLIDRIAGKK